MQLTLRKLNSNIKIILQHYYIAGMLPRFIFTPKGKTKMKSDKELEKEIMPWFNQWAKDEDADILEYFKSIFIEGREQSTSDILEMIDKVYNLETDLPNNKHPYWYCIQVENFKEELKQKIQGVGK